jgi:hypothetical protein
MVNSPRTKSTGCEGTGSGRHLCAQHGTRHRGTCFACANTRSRAASPRAVSPSSSTRPAPQLVWRHHAQREVRRQLQRVRAHDGRGHGSNVGKGCGSVPNHTASAACARPRQPPLQGTGQLAHLLSGKVERVEGLVRHGRPDAVQPRPLLVPGKRNKAGASPRVSTSRTLPLLPLSAPPKHMHTHLRGTVNAVPDSCSAYRP